MKAGRRDDDDVEPVQNHDVKRKGDRLGRRDYFPRAQRQLDQIEDEKGDEGEIVAESPRSKAEIDVEEVDGKAR